MRLAAAALLLVSTTAVADPKAEARRLLDAQLALIKNADDDAVKKLFAPDAVVLGSFTASEPIATAHADFNSALMSGGPHNVMKKLVVKSLLAGGSGDALWFTAEIEATFDNHEPEQEPAPNSRYVTRITELVAGGKIVAAVFDRPSKASGYRTADHERIANPTKAGSLAPLLAEPAELAKQLAKDAIVLGTEKRERGIGKPAAAKLLGAWTKLGLEVGPVVREVSTPAYTFAQASVVFRKTERGKPLTFPMVALAIANARGEVVVVHYAN